MKLKVFAKGFNYSQDGPGNRLVYHLQGCNMKCPWCANPESLNPKGTLMVGAGLLDSVCPHGAIADGVLNRKLCGGCGGMECIVEHKNTGITLSCEEYPHERMLNEVLSASPLFIEGGGVTFTGGEPTLQFESLSGILRLLKDSGINTAVETNATHPRLTDLRPFIDYFIIDFKHPDDGVHKQITGVSNITVKSNITKLVSEDVNLALRIPLINGFNTSEEALRGFLDFLSGLSMDKYTLELLTYHEYGKNKYERCGMEYNVKDANVPAETLNKFAVAFKAAGVNVIRT